MEGSARFFSQIQHVPIMSGADQSFELARFDGYFPYDDLPDFSEFTSGTSITQNIMRVLEQFARLSFISSYLIIGVLSMRS